MPKRTDANQQEIVEGLRAFGASVTDLHAVGKGCPDILVGYRGNTYVLEIKAPGGTLTRPEASWAASWTGGHYAVVRTLEQAVDVITQEIE